MTLAAWPSIDLPEGAELISADGGWHDGIGAPLYVGDAVYQLPDGRQLVVQLRAEMRGELLARLAAGKGGVP